ncbi:MAG: 7-cyano-7-deazaguanine synthase QueC [Pyrinomonadaceae bacterium]|nr:7-cyano-7-deazaguanine synthase QueC [Pyrinomonadaceae bacterium]
MTTKRDKSIVLVSGGMDSCVSAAIALNETKRAAFLHVSYGQITEDKERVAFNAIADHYGVTERLEVSIEYLAKIGGSSLTDNSIPVSDADPDADEIPSSYVPFRNANMLAIATSWAEVIGATRIYIGAVAEDSSGYPDCRPQFIDAFERMIEEGTKPGTDIKLLAPLIDMTKAEIVKRGIEIGAPLELTWSCYRNEDRACGTCDSCVLRLRGFENAGETDPIEYAELP